MERETPIITENIVAVEQARLWEAYWADPTDVALRNQLAEMNQKLVFWTLQHRISKATSEDENTREELEQEGFIGLLRAVELFDPTRGFTFATYAPHWIRQAITRYVANTRNPIRIPVHVGEMSSHIWKAEKAFFRQEGRHPNDFELAVFLGLPEEAVVELRALCTPKQVVSTNVLIGGSEGGLEFGDSFADTSAINPLQQILDKEPVSLEELLAKHAPDISRDQLKAAFQELPERMQEMIFLSAEDNTLESIGKRYGVTRERIRQIISKGIRKIRQALGVNDALPVRSIRKSHIVSVSSETVVHGITWATFTKRIEKVEEEVRKFGYAKLRLPPSVHVMKRRQSTSASPRVSAPKQKGHARKTRKPITVRLIPPKTFTPPIAATAPVAPATLPTLKRVQVNEQEHAIAEALWRRLSRGKGRYLDFELVAEELKLSTHKVHLVSCALIAKGVIQQDEPGIYQQGKPHLSVKVVGLNGKEMLEIDLAQAIDPEPDPSKLSELDLEILRLEKMREEVIARLTFLRERQQSRKNLAI